MNSNRNILRNSRTECYTEAKDDHKGTTVEFKQIWIKEEREIENDFEHNLDRVSFNGIGVNIKEEIDSKDVEDIDIKSKTEYENNYIKETISIKKGDIKREIHSNGDDKGTILKIKTENEYNEIGENAQDDVKIDEDPLKDVKPVCLTASQDGSTSQTDGENLFTVENIGQQFECGICSKRVAACNRFRHMRIHSDERPKECPLCRKSFVGKTHLKTHIKHHSDERPYECITCGKKFWQNAELIIHTRVHSGEKPFECETCNKKFASKSNLVKHCRMHSSERPFECEICKRRLSDKSNLTQHVQAHSGQRSYECKKCSKKYARNYDLKKHMRIHS